MSAEAIELIGREAEHARRLAEARRRLARAKRDLIQARSPDATLKLEQEVKALEATMTVAGFFDDPIASKPVIDRHQRLMWEVGDLMSQWEALQEHAAEEPATER